MATIQKSSKINFYKFVQVKDPAGASSAAKTDANIALTKSINTNTKAVNNLGSTVNSLAKVVADLKKIQLAQLDASLRNKITFKSEYTTAKKEKRGSTLKAPKLFEMPSFMDGIMNILGGLFKYFVVSSVLKWIGDPRNRKKIEDALNIIKKIVTFVYKIAKSGVVNTIEGLYTLLSDQSSPLEKFGGLLRGLTGLGTLMLGMRWLKNPTRIITDFGNTLIFLYNNLVRGRRGLLGRAGALGLVAAGAYGGYKAYNYLKEGQTTATQVEEGQEPENKPEGFSKGGKVKVPQKAMGGWINGPQSGYPVSLDGGRSTSFIGHGKEYVARKANGGAFVIPFNTPGTKTQPHLTDKRLGEAKSQGFDIGGLIGSKFKAGKGFDSSMGKSVIPDYAPESRNYAKGGKIPGFANGGNLNKQIYMHWVASTHTWKQGPYHTTVQGDGSLYKHKAYDQHTPHTYYRNTGNVGLSIAAMKDWNWERYGPTKPQLESLTAEAASIGKSWGWKPSDVTIKRVMTHAEAASNKDGRRPHDNYGPTFWGGNGERSDLHKLSRNAKDGSGGDILRQMVKKYMGMKNPPLLTEAGPGAGPGGNRGGADAKMGSKEYNLLQRLVIAEAGSEGKIGMALVARSVLNRAGLIQSGKVGPGMFSANDKSVTGVIMGPGQYQPVRDGSLNKPRTEQQMLDAKKAIEMARNSASLRGNLEAEGIPAGQINYLMGATGFRTGSAFNDPSQNVNVVQYKNHFFNTAGNKDVTHHLAEIENGGTGGGAGAGDYGASSAAETTTTYSLSDDQKQLARTMFGRVSSSRSIAEQTGVGYAKDQYSPSLGGSNFPSMRQAPREGVQAQTQQRDDARRQMRENTQTMINAALQAVAEQNGVNSQAIAMAQQAISSVMSQSQSAPPVLVGGGGATSGTSRIGGIVKTTAAALNSFNNPLKGILK